MISSLLESAPQVPTIVAGLIAFAALMIALIWVVGMGSGRPHS